MTGPDDAPASPARAGAAAFGTSASLDAGADLNAAIATRFEEVARLLEEQRANEFRVAAYRRAAETLRGLPRSVAEILDGEGLEGLERLPTIGESLARAIRALVTTGRLPMLDRLRGESDPEAVLMSVPGIGRALAERLHHALGIESLEELEMAAHDGRLRDLAGIGAKRLAGIQDVLQARLGRLRQRQLSLRQGPRPPVVELLDVDREYRARGAAGGLRTIAPRRFNPAGAAWLPILHTRRGQREYTALYSNTARAHRLGTTGDWVVLYYDGGGSPGQATVVTAQGGPLRGQRIVRGREHECEEHYGAAKW